MNQLLNRVDTTESREKARLSKNSVRQHVGFDKVKGQVKGQQVLVWLSLDYKKTSTSYPKCTLFYLTHNSESISLHITINWIDAFSLGMELNP